MAKRCPQCGVEKSDEDFALNGKPNRALRSACRACDARRKRATKLRKKYGITPEDFEQMWEEQGGLCLICSGELADETPNPAIDHDHETGEVRGLLCNPCNIGLGFFGDDIERLISAAMYLTRNKDVIGVH